MGPLVNAGIVTDSLNLVFAFLIGISFGWILEQAGFSSGRKITAVFYGRDFAVPKVMFTAMVTAGVGVILAHALGLMDATKLAMPPTFLWPHLLGGIIFGVGMVVSGYCPGTGLVSAAIGRIDAIVALVGIFIGSFLFAETSPLFWDFFYSGAQGRLSLVDVFHLPVGYVMLIVVGFALFFFFVADKVVPLVNKEPQPEVLGPWNSTAARWLTATVLFVCLIAGVGSLPLVPGKAMAETKGIDLVENLPTHAYAMDAGDVEQLINSGTEPFFLADLRGESDYAAGFLTGAYNIPADKIISGDGLELFPKDRKVILYDADGSRAFQLLPILRANGLNAYAMGGGLLGWAQLKAGEGGSFKLQAPTQAPPPPPKALPKKKGVAGFQDEGC